MKTLVKIQKNLGISGYCGLIHLSVTRTGRFHPSAIRWVEVTVWVALAKGCGQIQIIHLLVDNTQQDQDHKNFNKGQED